MFGSKKKAAVKAISQNVRPVLNLYQRSYGLPSHFWMHEYPLGFFSAYMSHHAKMATGGRITGTDLDAALVDGWGILSGQNGQQIWKRTAELAIEESVLFFEGFDRATMLFFLSVNRLSVDALDRDDVKSALASVNGDQKKASTIVLSDTFSDMNDILS